MSAQIIGIDVGALTCRVVSLDTTKKMPVVARNALSNEATPSISSYPEDGQRLFGEAAQGKEISRAGETVADLKKWLMAETTEKRSIGEHEFGVEQVLAFHLKNLLSYTKGAEEAAAIAVSVPNGAPAAVSDAIRVAAEVAGFDAGKVLTVEESHAVGAYFHHLQHSSIPSEEEEPLDVVVVNVGYQFSSVTAYSVKKGTVVVKGVETLAEGSEIIDIGLAGLVFDDIAAKKKNDIRSHAKSFQKVKRECKKAKEMLSSVDRTTVQVECLKDDIDVSFPVTRKQMEDVAAPFLANVKQMITAVKEKTGVAAGVRVEAVGGAWRAPCVQNLVKEIFGVERVGVSLDSMQAVGEGAAIAAAIAAADIGGEKREAAHNCTIEGVTPIAMEALSGALEEKATAFKATEKTMDDADELVRARLRAVDKLESFIFDTRRAVNECIKDQAILNKSLDKLTDKENWLYSDCDGATADEILAEVEKFRKSFEEEFPQVVAYAEEQAEIQRKKDEELERLSKLQEEDKELKTDPQRLRGAQQRREQGVTLFKQEHYQEAQTRFVQALGILGQLYAPSADDVKPKKNEIALSCHLNVASCSVKLGMWRNAINNCTNALEIEGQENNAKALYRRGQARAALHEHDEAMKDLIRAKEITNGDAAIVAEIAALEAKIDAQNKKEKKMFSKMFA